MLNLNVSTKIFNHPLFKNSLTLLSASALGQLAMVFFSPLLTRLYSPDDFGMLAIFSSILSVVVVVSRFRYELAIPLPVKDSFAYHLLGLSLNINFVISVITFVVVAFCAPFFGGEVDKESESLFVYLFLLPIAVLFFGGVKAYIFWFVRKKQFKLIAKAKLVQIFSNISTQLIAGGLGFGALGLVAGVVFGYFFCFFRLTYSAEKKFKTLSYWKNRSKYRWLAKKYRSFPRYDTPSALINTLSSELPQLTLGILFSPSFAGFYLLANRVLGVPLNTISQALGQVLYGSSSEELRKKRLDRVIFRIIIFLVLFISIPSVGIFLFSEQLFSFVFGSNWQNAGEVASILIVAIVFQFVYSPLSLNLLAVNGQQVNLKINFILLFFRGLSLVIGWLNNDPIMAIWLFSLSSAIVYLCGIFIIINRVKLHQRMTSDDY